MRGSWIDQEGQDVDLHVPVVVPLICLSSQAARGNAGPFTAPRCLQELKEIPANDLLHSRVFGMDLDVCMRSRIAKRSFRWCSRSAAEDRLMDRLIRRPSHLGTDLHGVRRPSHSDGSGRHHHLTHNGS